MTTRRRFLALSTATTLATATLTTATLTTATTTTATQTAAARPGRPNSVPKRATLTNLAQLRFLLAEVALPTLATHRTYGSEPVGLAPWTYADATGETFRRVGGGTLDPATGYWTQGAYNADDITRAAVVFLRAWQAGDEQSRAEAYGLLKTVAYLQNDSGPNAGRVILWQQDDGTLNPSAEPVELPDPSDSAESYWLARTVWALGEGYAAFRDDDPEFAVFLLARLHLAIAALEGESLARYPRLIPSDGVELPAWLIAGGADATAEAVLGLVAAVRARPDDTRLVRALDCYAEGIERLSTARVHGGIDRWPFGAVLPWTGSLGFWHAWGAAAPEALAVAGRLRGRPEWVRAALDDAGTFTPLVLASGGPTNAWAPAPGEAQIAYGAHGRVAATLAAARAGGGPGLLRLAGLSAAWFFGANPANTATYDPATGITFDGVEPDGRINRNSGAESTIHGLLTMLALDDHPEVARLATSIVGLDDHGGIEVVEAETARLGPGCRIVERPAGSWTGEGNLSGGRYVDVPDGGWVEFALDRTDGTSVHPLVWRPDHVTGTARWQLVGGPDLGRTRNGGTGPAGLTEVDGSLVPQRLGRPLPGGPVTLRCTSLGGVVRLDALLLRPPIASARYRTSDGELTLHASSLNRPTRVPGSARQAEAFDADGRRHPGRPTTSVGVAVAAGGFTVSS